MTASTVISNPASEIERLLGLSARGRCACCNGPALPVLEQRGDAMLCNRCSRYCTLKGGKYLHVIPPRTDRDAAERVWSRDLGFKQLGR